jgi:uncharacterized glyoxalase superfamily protein PhnB
MDERFISAVLTPSVSYRDLGQGIEWLKNVLGFRAAKVYAGPDGNIVFAELVWRTGVIFASQRPADGPWSEAGPSSIALAAKDAQSVDWHYQRALTAGAEVIRPLHDVVTPAFPDGSHQFDLRDPGGNLWTVGTFRPRIPVEQ